MPNCATCKERFNHPGEMLIVWNWDRSDHSKIAEIAIIHKGPCDDRRYQCSGGNAYGDDWYLQPDPFISPEYFLNQKYSDPCPGRDEVFAALHWVLGFVQAESRKEVAVGG